MEIEITSEDTHMLQLLSFWLVQNLSDRHSEPFTLCHSERSEESQELAQDKLREESQEMLHSVQHDSEPEGFPTSGNDSTSRLNYELISDLIWQEQ